MHRRPTPLLALVLLMALGALLLVLGGSGSDGHRLYANVDDVTGVVRGQKLRLAGRPVGDVAAVVPADRGRAARLELRIDDDQAWPLPRGSRFTLRWGGTVSYLKRYIAIAPGRSGSGTYGDGDTLAARSFTVPLEFDSLMNAFTPSTRRDLRTFVNRAGGTFSSAEPWLRQTVDRAPAAVREASELLRTLDGTGDRLTTLIGSTGRVVDAIRSADPSVEQAVSGAGQTLGATAAHAAELRETLAGAPRTFGRIRATLADADTTLDLAGDVTTRIAPGVRELRRTIAPLNSLLGTVVDVGPDARATLRTARTGAPDLSRLLRSARTQLPRLSSVSRQATPQLDCIRAYTPEIVALTTNWAGFISSVDGRDHYVRINPAAIPWAPTNVQGSTTAEAAERFPGLRFGLPRPPGDAAGQPWYQPQCEVTPDATDPRKDPEARPGETFPIPKLTRTPARGGRR